MLHRFPLRASLEDRPTIETCTSAIVPAKHPEENKNPSGRTWKLSQHKVAKQKNIRKQEAESGHSQSLGQGNARANHPLTSHTGQKNGDLSQEKRWRVDSKLSGRFVWAAGQHLTNHKFSITRHFCVEGLNTIRKIWQDELDVSSLHNNHPECRTAVNGDRVISGFPSEPAGRPVNGDIVISQFPSEPAGRAVGSEAAGRAARVKVCPESSQANKVSLVRACSQIDETNKESLTKVCPQTDEPKREPLITDCPTDEPKRGPLITDCPTDEPKREPLITGCCPTDEPKREPLITGCCPTDEPKREPLITNCPTDEPKRGPLITGCCPSPTDEPKREPLITGCCPTDEPKREPLITGRPTDEPKREPLITGHPTDEPKREPLITGCCPTDELNREPLITGCCQTHEAKIESLICVCPTDEPKKEQLVTGCCQKHVAKKESIEAQPGINGSFVNVCLQPDSGKRESRVNSSLNHLINIHHPRKETSVSQEYKIEAWRKGRCLVKVQHIYKRKSCLQASSRLDTRRKHLTHAALRRVKYTHTCNRRREITDNDKYMNTHDTQFSGVFLRDKPEHGISSNILRLLPKIVPHLQGTEHITSCLLNLNTNAGISDTCEKIEAKQASCTSLHSSDQYYSTHTDTPDGRVMDSDNEVSPSFSFTEEVAEKNAVIPHSNPDPVFSSSCDQVIKLRHLEKDRRTESETSKPTGHRRNAEEASNSETVDIKVDKHSRSGQGTLSLVEDDHQASKHKKKTKTTETVYIKFESSMSKKVTTTTTLLKDGKRLATNKSKSDTPKQLQGSDEGQRAISLVPERVDNRLMLDAPRHTKIVRCAEGHQESSEELTKCTDDMAASGVVTGESKQTAQNVARVTGSDVVQVTGENVTHVTGSGLVRATGSGLVQATGSEVVRVTGSGLVLATGSDDHLHHLITPPLSSTISESMGKASSISEKSTSQKSPKKSHSPQGCLDSRIDLVDSDYPSEKESSVATIVNMPKVSPRHKISSMKEGKEHMMRIEGVNKLDKIKPSDCSLRDIRVVREKRDQSKHISPNREISRSRGETEGRNDSHTITFQLPKTETALVDTSTTTDAPFRKRTVAKHKGDSFQKRSPVYLLGKHDLKKCVPKVRSRTTDGLPTKEDMAEHWKGKVQQSTCSRKRSPGSSKTQSRSPEPKRRKRSVKKTVESKCLKSPEYWRSDRSKRNKSSEKTSDKKKKKKKLKQKATAKSEVESPDKLSSVKKAPALARNRSTESDKTSQGVSSSTSAAQFVEASSLSEQVSPDSLRNNEDSKLSQQEDGLRVGSDTENSTKCREMVIKHRATSSAENVSMSEEASKPIRAAESVPTFTGTVYTSITKVVQVAPCPKGKKSEKDLQQAELGWNSSTMSAEEKAAVEKIKQNQRRIKAKYYLMKSRAKSNEYEAATSRARRSMPRRNHADGDNGINDKGDTSQSEKTKYGQGKSVQFSESTEKHEASRDETAEEYSTFQDSKENDGTQIHPGNKFTIVLQPSGKTIVLPQPPSLSLVAGKLTVETARPQNRSDADASHTANKPTSQKKEESRSQTTPPRKKQAVWQKKVSKEKASTNTKAPNAALKTAHALLSIKQRQSSDNILKPSGRLHLGFFCPARSKMQSPSFSNISLGDKRTVAYNTWINSSVLAGPMNKATKKLVAKTGSPVDIKEIIEGSSVDAADYHKSMRSLHEMGVRAAKSVPSLGPRRTTSTDGAGSRRMKLHAGGQKKHKVHESSSTRSLSSVDGSHEQGFPSKHRSTGIDPSVSPASSTDVDNGPGSKYRVGSSRLNDHGYPRKKKDKHGKKFMKDASGKWHVVHAKDVHSFPDLTRVQYYGDETDINSINMGLSWVVQSVFSRLPFLNQRPAASSANASGDMPVGQVGE